MIKNTEMLRTGDVILALDEHELRASVRVTKFVKIYDDGTVVIEVEQPTNWITSPVRYLRHQTATVEDVRLTDSELAEIIGSLQIVRDNAKVQGRNAPHIESALAKINSHMTPATYGVTLDFSPVN